MKTLAVDLILDKARFFYGKLTKVPTIALMVGMGTHMDATVVTILSTDAHRAFALYTAIEEGVNHRCTCLPSHSISTLCLCVRRMLPWSLKGRLSSILKVLFLFIISWWTPCTILTKKQNRNGSLLRNHTVTSLYYS